jgi:hypothetical protein
MADPTFQHPGFLKMIIDKLRGVPSGGPGPQLDGYRQYVNEQQASGDPAMSYAEWIKGQSPVGGQ